VLRLGIALFRCYPKPACGFDEILWDAIPLKGHLPKTGYRRRVFEEFQLTFQAIKFFLGGFRYHHNHLPWSSGESSDRILISRTEAADRNPVPQN